MSFRICVESANVSYNECAEWADQGYRECDNWRRECCDWWPCNWFCEIVSWFCTAWVWVSNIVCVAWKTVTLVVCLVWSVVEFLLAPLAALIELIKAIPGVGRLVDMIWNIVTTVVWRVIRIPDNIMSFVGVEPVLTVRLCVLVLRFGGAYPTRGGREITREDIQSAVAAADKVWLDAANIHVVLDHIAYVAEDAPQEAAFPGCGDDILAEHFGLAGSYYQLTAARACPLGSVGRLTGVASRIIVVVVERVTNSGGCALGPLNDYLVLPGGNLVCLAHELGHKFGLAHHGPPTNIMAATSCAGTDLEWWQRAWVRSSKYASHV